MECNGIRLLWPLAAAAALGAQSLPAPPVPRAELRGLEKVAGDLLKAGRAAEWDDLLTVLGQLGVPAKDVAAQRAAGTKDAAKPHKPGDDSRLAKALRDAARPLAAHLVDAGDDESHRRLAQLLLT